MSDRLAFSAALSVLMMSAFVLFGQDVARESLMPGTGVDGGSVSLPRQAEAPLHLLLPR